MSMEDRKTSSERREWLLHPMPMPLSTSASRTSSPQAVVRPIPVSVATTSNQFTEAVMNPSRHIELDIDIGADARDWSAIQAQEKLKPTETELRRVEELVSEIVSEMDYLRTREQKLRDTNESTNERVKWFAFGTMGMLVGLGAWQVVYLRAYFRSVILGQRLLRGIRLTQWLQVEAFDIIVADCSLVVRSTIVTANPVNVGSRPQFIGIPPLHSLPIHHSSSPHQSSLL